MKTEDQISGRPAELRSKQPAPWMAFIAYALLIGLLSNFARHYSEGIQDSLGVYLDIRR